MWQKQGQEKMCVFFASLECIFELYCSAAVCFSGMRGDTGMRRRGRWFPPVPPRGARVAAAKRSTWHWKFVWGNLESFSKFKKTILQIESTRPEPLFGLWFKKVSFTDLLMLLLLNLFKFQQKFNNLIVYLTNDHSKSVSFVCQNFYFPICIWHLQFKILKVPIILEKTKSLSCILVIGHNDLKKGKAIPELCRTA